MPTPAVTLPSAVVEVAAGGQRTCAQIDSGEYFCWGSNLGGDLGLGHNTPLGDDPGEMPPPLVPVFRPGGQVVAVVVVRINFAADFCAHASPGAARTLPP